MKNYVSDQLKQKKQPVKLEFPNERTTDFERIVNEWWDSLDIYKSKEVPIIEICKFFIQKGILSKQFEVLKMIKKVIGKRIPLDGVIKQSQY